MAEPAAPVVYLPVRLDGIEIREVAPDMLPDGRWWMLAPPGLAGVRLVVMTSDLERFRREIVAAGGDADQLRVSQTPVPERSATDFFEIYQRGRVASEEAPRVSGFPSWPMGQVTYGPRRLENASEAEVAHCPLCGSPSVVSGGFLFCTQMTGPCRLG